jgi:hypothetical protein
MTSREIFEKYVAEQQIKTPALIHQFNSGLGVWKRTRQLYYLWRSGGTRPGRKILQYAMEVYGVDDWRHNFAVDLYQAHYEQVVAEGEPC